MPADCKISFKLDEKMYNNLTALAAKRNVNLSELVRTCINQGLDKELACESVDFIREQIHDEIKAVCFPQFDRIAKLTAKIAYQTVADFYLSAYIMESVLPVSKQKDFDEIKRKSKMMAIAYLKLNENEFDEFAKSDASSSDLLKFKDGGRQNDSTN